MYDVIVVGAGTSGCSLAMLLARRGYRVLLLERDGVGSDTPLSHNLGPVAVLLLERWGLLDQVVATRCPPGDRTTVWVGSDLLELPNPPEAPLTYALRRAVLVSLISAAAVAAGTEFRPAFSVRDLVWESGAVSGVVGHGGDGHSVYERAHIVVGADGRSSIVARVVQAEAYGERPATNCCYYAFWRGIAGPGPEVFLCERRAVAVYPTDGGLAWVVAARPVTDWAQFKRAPERMYLNQLRMFSELARRLEPPTRESRFGGTADLGSGLRRPWGPGWALVGDAGQPADTSISFGIPDVFAQAQMMADAIDEGLSGHRSLSEALATYHHWRDTQAEEAYEATRALGSYDWSLVDVADIVVRVHAARLRELGSLVSLTALRAGRQPRLGR